MGHLDRIRNAVEERVDRFKVEHGKRFDDRRKQYELRAREERVLSNARDRDKYNKREISKDLYEARRKRTEDRYESSRLTPEEKAERVSMKVVSGSAAAVAAFAKDFEQSAKAPQKRPRMGRKIRSSGGGFGGVDFGSLDGMFSSGGGGRSYRGGGDSLDFSSLDDVFAPRKKR